MDKIYAELVETFNDTTSTAPKIDQALEAMRFIAPLSETDMVTNSHDLFYAIMRAPVSPAYSEENKWGGGGAQVSAPLPRPLGPSRTSTQPNHLSCAVSALRSWTSGLAKFARLPFSSFLSSPIRGSTPLTQS